MSERSEMTGMENLGSLAFVLGKLWGFEGHHRILGQN